MSASGIAPSHRERSRLAESVGVIDVSVPRSSTGLVRRLRSFAGAVGVALLVPWVMLLVGLPIVVAVRGLAEVIAWLIAGSGG